MAYISRNAEVSEISKIVDTPKVLSGFILFIIFVIITLLFINTGIDVTNEEGKSLSKSLIEIICHPLVFIPAILALITIIRVVINAKGIIINVPENKLFFPGGGIDANSWTDYLKPSFLFQYFDRKNIPLDEIRYIQEFTDTTYWTDSKGRRRSTKHKMLEITGNFGAVTFEFYSKGKMDQLYSAIINLNKMGIPVSNR